MWLRPALLFACLATALPGQGVVPPCQVRQIHLGNTAQLLVD